MTANVTAIVAESRNALKVPNAALRFRSGTRPHAVWKIAEKGELEPLRVKLGITDGAYTEVLSGDLKPGDQAATGQANVAENARTPVRNPMMPFGGARGGRR